MIRTTSRIRRQLGAGLLGLSIALVAAGCAGSDVPTTATESPRATATESAPSAAPEAAPTEATPTDESTPTLSLQSMNNGQGNVIVLANGATAAGTETLSEKLITADRGCFHATARDAAPTLLIFPEGTTLSSNGKPAVQLGEASYSVGSQLAFTGTTVTLSAENLAEASPCEPHGAVFLVSSITN